MEAKRTLRHQLEIIAIYLVCTAAFLTIALILRFKAFPPAVPPGQAFVVAFTEDEAARVLLTVHVDPDKPWYDTVSVDAKRTSTAVGSDRWLLVIQCPAVKSALNESLLYTEAVGSQPASAIPVTMHTGMGQKSYRLGCFKHSSTNGSIASVVLPGLETDQSISAIQTPPTVYLAQLPTLPLDVIQVFHGCPPPTPPGSSSPAGASSPSTPPTSSASGAPTVAASAAAVSPGCSSQTRWRTLPVVYYLPASMQTREVLKYVNLSGYQTESMFPVPQITAENGGTGQNAEEQYTWNGLSSLSPTLLVSNYAQAQSDNRYTFNAGVFFGLCGATGVALFEKLWGLRDLRRKRDEDQPQQGAAETPAPV